MKQYSFEEIIQRLLHKGICSVSEAYEYLVAEDQFYDMRGLSVYAEDMLEPSKLFSDTVIDQDDVDKYIFDNTDLSMDLIRNISYELYEYMCEEGIKDSGLATYPDYS